MTADPSLPEPSAPELSAPEPLGAASPDPGAAQGRPEYAHMQDAQARRTRVELWVILAVVVVVVLGAVVWRAATGRPAGPQAGWNRNDPNAEPPSTAAAGAGVPVKGVGAPTTRPVAP